MSFLADLTRRTMAVTELVLFTVLIMAALLFSLHITGLLPVVPCMLEDEYRPLDKTMLHGSGSIYLIPLNNFPHSTVKALAESYHQKYGVPTEVGPPVTLPDSVFDKQRGQYESESLLRFLRHELMPLLSTRELVVIALTDQDMYIASYRWRYAFSYRDAPFAVVSSANMDYGLITTWPAGRDRRDSRFRKMVTKNIGILYYHLPPSNHCGSVLYGHVGGPQELDIMGEDF